MKTLLMTLVLVSILAVSMANATDILPENAVERQSASQCDSHCRFNFCDGVSAFKFGQVIDKSSTGSICKTDGTLIGIVGQSGEALVNGKIAISKYRPAKLQQNFSPHFFKTFFNQAASGRHGQIHSSGVGHETPQQNQAAFLAKCFVLPLRAYQVVSRSTGHVVDNVHTDDPRDCISFRGLKPKPRGVRRAGGRRGSTGPRIPRVLHRD